MQLENEQALISKKKVTNAFSVNRKLINSKDFRDKFDELELSPEVASKVYKEVGRLLEYVDGQENEYLVALDYNTGERIVDNFGREACARKTGFNLEELTKISNSSTEIITIHNHSYNGRPSAQDLITFYNQEIIRISIIACHTGELYAIFKVTEEALKEYNNFLQDAKLFINDFEFAKMLANTRLHNLNDTKSKKKKLFEIKRL